MKREATVSHFCGISLHFLREAEKQARNVKGADLQEENKM
jgi:hypothetical protein